MKLTPKREKFCRLIAEGKEQLEAYDLAGFSKKQTKRARTSNASKLMQDTDIILTIETYKKQITKNLDLASQITVERQLKTIQLVLNPLLKKARDGEALTDGEVRSVVSLTQEQNKLIGLYAPTKTENKTEITGYTIQTNLENLNE